MKPLAAREEPWQLCARCRPRQTKQETAKKKKGRKARRRREEAPPPPPPQPKRESPQDDARKQSAARGRAFRSERRALARHGVGDAADPLNGGVYAETRRLRLRFARSPIHSWGVFTDEPIVQGRKFLEYRGEEIGLQVGERRQEMYERNGEIDYLFRVDDQLIVDATRMGSLARFVNHSCAPNCVSKIVRARARKKIVLYEDVARCSVAGSGRRRRAPVRARGREDPVPLRRGDVSRVAELNLFGFNTLAGIDRAAVLSCQVPNVENPTLIGITSKLSSQRKSATHRPSPRGQFSITQSAG